ncbi:MAG: hypothetical protein MJ051_02675 [Akkermansia sp.]|nr:hypothetical protein [Akkermansia sp.]
MSDVAISIKQAGIYPRKAFPAVAFWCLIAALLINLFCNSFSPFFIPEGAMDPNCFYAEGCAISQGYLPYRDFIDVKGPLLFLIYTIGYLMSPTQCYGIFLIYVLTTWGTLIAFYRTAELFGLSRRCAVFATALAVCCLFSKYTAYWAAQPEHFLVLPLSWTFYYLTAFLKHPEATFLRPLAWWLGSGATCAFLIKFNFVLPYVAVFALAVFVLARQQRLKDIVFFVIRCAAAFILICIPFALYFFYHGLWGDFYHAYVTLNLEANLNQPQIEWGRKFSNRDIRLSYLVLGHAVVRASYRQSAVISKTLMRYLLVVIPATFFSSFIGMHGYYYILMAPAAIFLCIDAAGSKAAENFLQRRFLIKSALFALIFIFVINAFCISHMGWRRPAGSAAQIAKVQEMIARIPSPKIIYYSTADILLGRKAASLPGTPAWMSLSQVKTIYVQRDIDVMGKKADFIVTQDDVPEETLQLLQAAGYESIPQAQIPKVNKFISNVQVWAQPQTMRRCTENAVND